MRRTPLRRQSKRRAESPIGDVPRLVREQVMARAGYRCEVRGEDCEGSYGLALHHRLRRSQGGEHDSANLICVCPADHALIHNHPERAYALGLLIHRHDGPPTECWNPSPPGATL